MPGTLKYTCKETILLLLPKPNLEKLNFPSKLPVPDRKVLKQLPQINQDISYRITDYMMENTVQLAHHTMIFFTVKTDSS